MAEYIDREVFKKSVEEYYCKPCKAEGKDHNGCWCRACWVDDMLDEIDCFQPAADAAPVVHAHWLTWEEQFPGKILRKKSRLGLFCSACHNYSDNISDYCPNCGAKMGADTQEREGV